VGRKIKAFAMNDDLLCAAADLLGGFQRSLGKECPEPFALPICFTKAIRA